MKVTDSGLTKVQQLEDILTTGKKGEKYLGFCEPCCERL